MNCKEGAHNRQAAAPRWNASTSSLLDFNPELEVKLTLAVIAMIPVPWLIQFAMWIAGCR